MTKSRRFLYLYGTAGKTRAWVKDFFYMLTSVSLQARAERHRYHSGLEIVRCAAPAEGGNAEKKEKGGKGGRGR